MLNLNDSLTQKFKLTIKAIILPVDKFPSQAIVFLIDLRQNKTEEVPPPFFQPFCEINLSNGAGFLVGANRIFPHLAPL